MMKCGSQSMSECDIVNIYYSNSQVLRNEVFNKAENILTLIPNRILGRSSSKGVNTMDTCAKCSQKGKVVFNKCDTGKCKN